MRYITAIELGDRLPLDGEGLSSIEIQEALDAAVEDVAGQTGDTGGESALLRQAVINLAMAELFDTKIYPRDARRPGSESSALRESAARSIATYLKIKTDRDENPLTLEASTVYMQKSPF